MADVFLLHSAVLFVQDGAAGFFQFCVFLFGWFSLLFFFCVRDALWADLALEDLFPSVLLMTVFPPNLFWRRLEAFDEAGLLIGI